MRFSMKMMFFSMLLIFLSIFVSSINEYKWIYNVAQVNFWLWIFIVTYDTFIDGIKQFKLISLDSYRVLGILVPIIFLFIARMIFNISSAIFTLLLLVLFIPFIWNSLLTFSFSDITKKYEILKAEKSFFLRYIINLERKLYKLRMEVDKHGRRSRKVSKKHGKKDRKSR